MPGLGLAEAVWKWIVMADSDSAAIPIPATWACHGPTQLYSSQRAAADWSGPIGD